MHQRPNLARGWLSGCLLLLTIGAAAAEPHLVTDATGREVAVEDGAQIVSVGGSITEILYALGLEARIVAVDDTSTYPPAALQDKPSVGYVRALSPEGVLSAGGTLILAEADAGPPEIIEVLEEASISLVRVPEARDLDGIVDKVRIVAQATGEVDAGTALADDIRAQFERVRQQLATVQDPVRAMFILSMRDGRLMAAGEGTAAAAVLEMAGARNALTGFSGYKPVNAEAIIQAAPEAVVMMARGDHAASATEVFSDPALSTTPAADTGRLITMDGLYLLGFGPRTAEAIRDLAAELYPELDLQAGDGR